MYEYLDAMRGETILQGTLKVAPRHSQARRIGDCSSIATLTPATEEQKYVRFVHRLHIGQTQRLSNHTVGLLGLFGYTSLVLTT